MLVIYLLYHYPNKTDILICGTKKNDVHICKENDIPYHVIVLGLVTHTHTREFMGDSYHHSILGGR